MDAEPVAREPHEVGASGKPHAGVITPVPVDPVDPGGLGRRCQGSNATPIGAEDRQERLGLLREFVFDPLTIDDRVGIGPQGQLRRRADISQGKGQGRSGIALSRLLLHCRNQSQAVLSLI